MSVLGRLALVLAVLALTAVAADPKPRVAVEVLSRAGTPVAAAQQWSKVLTEAGMSGVQIRSGTARDEVSLTEQSGGFKVIGILTADNVLHLPGGKFTLGETVKLRKWLDNLTDQGVEGISQQRSAFGLIAKQLAQVNDDLKRRVDFSTLGMPARKAVDRIAGGLKLSLEIDPAAVRELAEVKVADELEGLSSGTALAIALRPAGLALLPERPTGGSLRYKVTKAQAGRESWPIGWTPKQRPSDALPALFEMLNVEIADTTVSDSLEAIRGRLKVPFLFDRNAMALHGLDPKQVTADVPAKRLSYSQILNKILLQAKLKYELRIDEADQPFLWITSVKPA